MKKSLGIVFLVIVLITASACFSQIQAPENDHEYNDDNKNTKEESILEDESIQEIVVDYEKVQPNELGEVMVLMYHNFGHEEKDEWWRSFENFRKDLQILYDNNYRLISMRDFINDNIDVPVGTTPVVFTFDDATYGQYNLIEVDRKLQLNSESAVGIMKEFHDNHPDFGFEATFYINDIAFSGSEGTERGRLEHLIELGLDIGNHTYGHTSLANNDPQIIQEAIGKNTKRIKEYFSDYEFNTLALPNGQYSQSNFDYIVSGAYNDISYRNEAILLVGWKPSPPPAHNDYYPHKMLRVRASEGYEFDMYYYLDYFNNNPNMRYISDGDINTICFPERLQQHLNSDIVGDREVITYTMD